MTRRRLHPQIGTSEEVSGMPLRRSPRLHPQIHATGNGVGMTRRGRRRRGKSPADPESLPLHEDMLREILLRLPPQPSSLLRASAVCKNWRGLITDPRFLRRFRAHQGKPPLLGVFESHIWGIKFRSTLGPPDRIPPERFDLQHQIDRRSGIRLGLLGCRHGRVLLLDDKRNKVIVCDPITGEHHRLDVPPAFRGFYIYGAVLCAAADDGHVHGSCHSSPFNVVLMSLSRGGDKDEYDDEHDYGDTSPMACVYSSETAVWGNLISTMDRCELDEVNPGILIGNALYWSSKSVIPNRNVLHLDYLADDVVEFDLDRQSLAVIKGPPSLNGSLRHQIIRAEDNALGLAIFSHGRFEVWQRWVSCHGGTTWLLHNTFEVHTLLGLPPQIEGSMRKMEILGYDEDNRAIIVFVDGNVYMVQPMSTQFRKLYESRYPIKCHPFASFYTPDPCCKVAPHKNKFNFSSLIG
ncbi:hypothetical protein QYE76_063394 [Lolium multiflorum]|uniref:F-box domain-containing protein n=1 Tax=Lolium multiflorum TaxID=4521 RepID=A0AAD8W915_LOLMU|nr:hypothetical protein QYE76_063394 [Lolium multiflorum]